MSAGELSDTSAFVTILAGRGIHTSPQSQKYLDMLDLSAGEELIRRCSRVWPHLDQLVKNRKWCIMEYVMGCLSEGMGQVVILGSGMDPLSLEIASRAPNATVYEMDVDNMDAKRRLLDAAAPDVAGNIRCVTADLGLPEDAAAEAVAAGWRPEAPSVLVMEGISYYLGEGALLDLMRRFAAGSEGRAVLEYIVPPGLIEPERADIPGLVFGAISNYLSDPLEVSWMDPDRVRELVSEAGGSIVRRHTMHSMELERTGVNRHFPTERSGWVEVCLISTRPA